MPSLLDGDVRQYVAVNSQAVERAIASLPEVFNAELNRAFAAIGTGFARIFTSTRLRGGAGIRMRKRGRSAGGPPALPLAMRGAGFKGKMGNRERLDGKYMWIGTRAPHMLIHELGGTISAKNSNLGLAIPFSKMKKKQAKKDSPEAKAAFALQRGNIFVLFTPLFRKGKLVNALRGLAHFAQSVRMRARLGFISTWRGYEANAILRVDKAIDRALHRIGSEAPRSQLSSTAFYSFEGGGMEMGEW